MIDLAVLGMEMMALCFAIRKHGKCCFCLLLNLDIIAVIANYVYTNKFCFCNFIFTLLYSIPSPSHLHASHLIPSIYRLFVVVCFHRTNLTRVSEIITVKCKITAKNNTNQNACIFSPNTGCI